MSSEPGRRFTDREVALVLRRASEMEEAEGPAAAGLSLEDLQDIGREVGISADAIARAVSTLERRDSAASVLAGAPLVHKAVRAVPGRLDEAALGGLVHLVDERADGAGSVSQALGSLRWTSADRFRSMQVSITPGDGETHIQVVEKSRPRLRLVVQLMPAAWGAMLAAPLLGLGAVGGFALAGGALVGGAIGRAVWTAMSSRSHVRVTRLADSLAAEAHGSARAGGDVERS